MLLNLTWKLFDKIYSNFILSNSNDVSNFLNKNFYGIVKIKNIGDFVEIRKDLMTEEDDVYKEKNIKEVYNIIEEKFTKNIPLNNFESNLHRYVLAKFDNYKLLKTVFLSIYFTILFTLLSITISVLISFYLR